MGSLTSRPDITPVQQPVYVPVQTAAPQPAPPVSARPEEEAGSAPQENAEEQQREAGQEREQSLLKRSRGRAGTVLTSFRGLLSDSANTARRKTLLGE